MERPPLRRRALKRQKRPPTGRGAAKGADYTAGGAPCQRGGIKSARGRKVEALPQPPPRTEPLEPLLERGRSRAARPGGVQGQSPWPCFLPGHQPVQQGRQLRRDPRPSQPCRRPRAGCRARDSAAGSARSGGAYTSSRAATVSRVSSGGGERRTSRRTRRTRRATAGGPEAVVVAGAAVRAGEAAGDARRPGRRRRPSARPRRPAACRGGRAGRRAPRPAGTVRGKPSRMKPRGCRERLAQWS